MAMESSRPKCSCECQGALELGLREATGGDGKGCPSRRLLSGSDVARFTDLSNDTGNLAFYGECANISMS